MHTNNAGEQMEFEYGMDTNVKVYCFNFDLGFLGVLGVLAANLRLCISY
jgi:hypothetical protein